MAGSDARGDIPELYILWHPDCRIGKSLADAIYSWLRPGRGLGPDIFFRSLPEPGKPRGCRPLPLPSEAPSANDSREGRSRLANLEVVVPLIDANMVADPTWRHWIDSLAKAPSGSDTPRVLFPVALDATAYKMPGIVQSMNYLRPAGIAALPEGETQGPEFERVARSLLKQLTEALCRWLLPRRTGTKPASDTTAKIAIFLSHSKQDGTVPAQRLRDYIYGQTQMAAFYDENDIAFGTVFKRILDESLSSEHTAALIAVRSKSYASRPWCRRELSVFRKPQQGKRKDGREQWRLYPTLVVEAMDGSDCSPGIAEIGNSTIVRWNEADRELEEFIVTTVIRDAMLSAYHSALGAALPARAASSPYQRRVVINWLPDPMTLLHILAAKPRLRGPVEILYPGRGLSGQELDILLEVFPKITFCSFEEALA